MIKISKIQSILQLEYAELFRTVHDSHFIHSHDSSVFSVIVYNDPPRLHTIAIERERKKNCKQYQAHELCVKWRWWIAEFMWKCILSPTNIVYLWQPISQWKSLRTSHLLPKVHEIGFAAGIRKRFSMAIWKHQFLNLSYM